MHSILEDLFYGRLDPIGQAAELIGEIRENERKKDELFYKLAGALPPEARQELEEFSELCAQIAADNECGGFICGFRLGARLIAEACFGKG